MEEKDVDCSLNKRSRLVSTDEDKECNLSGVIEDRLSSLPNSLLVQILSLLPIRSAAATSILSPQWRHLWTQVTCLCFENCPVTTANHILSKLTSPKLQSFRVCYNWRSDFNYDSWSHFTPHIQEWVRQICSRNPEEIELDMWSKNKRNVMDLPSCFFVCRSLAVVKLGMGCNIKLSDIENIDMPMLKKLRVHVSDVNRESIGMLIKRCPALEDVELITVCEKRGHVLDVSGRKLRRLTIKVQERSVGGKVLIYAPQLEEFNLSGTDLLDLEYYFVDKFSGGGLHKADISVDFAPFRDHDDDDYEGALDLVHEVSSVTFLDINGALLHCLCQPCDADLPIFSHLTHLAVDIDSFADHETNAWSDMLHFIWHCPNLEVFVIRMEDYVVEEGDWIAPDCAPPCFIDKLKRIEIMNLNFEGIDDELIFLKYVLCNANVLERLLVGISHANIEITNMERYYEDFLDRGGVIESDDDRGDGEEFCEKLFSYQRSSSACEIEVQADCFSASTDDGSERGFKFIPHPSPPSRSHSPIPGILFDYLFNEE